jgi:heptosyltransferase-1
MNSKLVIEPGRALRVLIVRVGAMGDVLHAMPAVAALRERHPEWFIGWAIEPRWSELLQAADEFDRNPYAERSEGKPLVDVWHPVSTQTWKQHPFAMATIADINATRRKLRGWEYDVCVDMQGSIRSAVVGRMAATKVFAGAAEPRERQATWLYKQKVALSAEHVVEQGCELLGAAFGETLRPAKVTLPIDSEDEAWCDRLLTQILARGEKFVFIAPTAGWGAKQWPAERYGAVAAELAGAGFRVLINEALGDRTADGVVAASGGAAVLVPCSVGQMIALVRRAGVVIAGDTGPLHLAAALQRPVVALFGPTDPARNGPFGTEARVLRHGPERRDHSRRAEPEAGLLEITVGEVVEGALELLRDGQDKVDI